MPDETNAGRAARSRRDPMNRDDILRSLTEAHVLVGDVEIDQIGAEMKGAHVVVSRAQREVLQRISNQLTDMVVAIEEDA